MGNPLLHPSNKTDQAQYHSDLRHTLLYGYDFNLNRSGLKLNFCLFHVLATIYWYYMKVLLKRISNAGNRLMYYKLWNLYNWRRIVNPLAFCCEKPATSVIHENPERSRHAERKFATDPGPTN